MSPRRKTEPPTREHSRSSSSGRNGLIAREKTKKQSAKRRNALDNRFHRTRRSRLRPVTYYYYFTFSRGLLATEAPWLN